MDAFIDQLVPLLDAGDIIIDGGNSEYQDTQRRWDTCSGYRIRVGPMGRGDRTVVRGGREKEVGPKEVKDPQRP